MARMAGRRPVSARRWPCAAMPGAPSASRPEKRIAPHMPSGMPPPVAVVVERQRSVVLVLVDLHVGVVARERRALVGRSHARLGDQGARDGGPPESLAGPGHDGPALGERLLRKRFPDGVGEVAAEMGQSDHRMLRAVHAARQRRHQGDCRCHDADDRPGAEAEAPLPRGIDRAGGGVPDQQEARQHQDARVEGEEHVADGGRPVPAQPAQESQRVPGGAVGIGEEAAVDGLRERRLGRRHQCEAETGEGQDRQQQREARRHAPPPIRRPHACKIVRPREAGARHPVAALYPLAVSGTLLPAPGSHPPRLFQAPEQLRSGPQRLGERAAELGSEQEAEGTHGLSWRRRPGWRGRAGGASLRRSARASRHRWRPAARRCASAASRASARPPA